MPFGKCKGLSVEQIALKDYSYFAYVLDNIPIKKRSLEERWEFVEYVANHFKSKQACGLPGCGNPAEHISVYHNYTMNYRGSSIDFVYCSKECFEKDPKVTDEPKAVLGPLAFRTAVSSTKTDTNGLIKIIAECMGIRKSRLTKEYLEDFFDNCQLR